METVGKVTATAIVKRTFNEDYKRNVLRAMETNGVGVVAMSKSLGLSQSSIPHWKRNLEKYGVCDLSKLRPKVKQLPKTIADELQADKIKTVKVTKGTAKLTQFDQFICKATADCLNFKVTYDRDNKDSIYVLMEVKNKNLLRAGINTMHMTFINGKCTSDLYSTKSI